MGKLTVLVCDDDSAIVDALEIYLKQENYEVVKAYTGVQALKALSEREIHLVLLDIMMPELDGLATTIKIREEMNIPIIILSAKSEDTDKITGLNFGADDYVTKPFNPLELMARVKSQTRRYTSLGSLASKNGILKTGSLELDPEARELRVDGEPVKLTATEYGIVLFLMQNMGRVFSIDQIYEHVWNEPSYTAENTVPVHIRRIREKIEINPREPKYLKVVWGVGYKMEKL
ncbi:response regulator transcription factor [Desulfoscipio geothermicus]|uniref:Stage 0 sporulation protein A homolog n=1 Tax=Desulfoscipio geothermicus DSM 3669 TaxID=1121426 RepID=A0A1I6ELY9_9FIRM|nr:response regulator transcription factor [Desulfoscipio geothermicus]SFR18528.1 DNA-binding response regulator, OmpR family, contains REC and winged-helix (wHTH) domain [Desulfoscipio geothermicus DSM 3669]